MADNEAGLQMWVTYAKNDKEALQALTMASSLKMTCTTKKITILIKANNINPEIRSVLDEIFDFVSVCEESQDENVDPDIYAKLQLFKLTLCEKCIYVDPNLLVTRNGDHLFKEEAPKICITKTERDIASLFLFKPSIATWKDLMRIATQHSTENVDVPISLYKCLESWMISKRMENSITDKHMSSIDNEDCFTTFPSNYSIFKMHEECQVATKEKIRCNSGMEMFLKLWRHIFQKKVFPAISMKSACVNIMKSQRAYMELEHGLMNGSIETSSSFGPEHPESDIAVIGMSCRFPGANCVEEFWELILRGVDAISKVPDSRWNPKEAEFLNTQAGFLKCAIEEFDAKFFGISPREAGYMDPQQRLMLEVTWEALENAGINPLELLGSDTGVFTGIWRHDYEKLMMKANNFSDEFQRTYLGNSHAASSARISFNLGLNGPNIATESGCSSSMVSVHLACESLRRGDSTLALAGGVNLLVRPFTRDTMFASHVLAEDGRCKTFDESADGFGRAEGCGILVLKKYSQARRDGDRVLAIIRGSAITQEGTTTSFGTPSRECQQLAISRALHYSRVDPLDVSYIEAHGTGTKKGDPTEISAIAAGYGNTADAQRKSKLLIGSVKTNIGHAESAAGVAGLIKVILAMNKKLIPPHRNLKSLNPLIDLESIPAEIPLSPVEWKSPDGKPLIAGVSSFGISGTNVHMLLEEPGNFTNYYEHGEKYARPQHILALSAKSAQALDELVTSYGDFLKENPEVPIEDVAFTANVGRAHFSYRTAFVGSDSATLLQKLKSKSPNKGKVRVEKQKIVFLFPGQGSQYEGMAQELYRTHPVFRDSMDYCTHILKEYLGINLLNVMWGGGEGENVDNEGKTINDSLYSQTAIFCIEYSLLQLWKSFGIRPDIVIGHSLGEMAAAVAAEILSIEEILKLVYVRTRLIDSLPHGAMMACKTSLAHIEGMLTEFAKDEVNGWIDIACNNSADQVVLSAKRETLEKFKLVCKAQGMKTHILAATHAYHSRDMEVILPEYFRLASTLEHREATCQYISGMTGELLERDGVNPQYWIDHCRHSVNFVKAIQTAEKENTNVFIEVGPQPVLLALAMENMSPNTNTGDLLWLPSIKKQENNWTTILTAISSIYTQGGGVDWKGFDSPYIRNKIPLPSYPFQRQPYWFESKGDDWSIAFNSTLLHPLIGRKIPLVTQDHVYQHNLDLETLAYLGDHQVASKIIVPCTGLLEMVTAAGHCALQGNSDIFSEPLTPLLVEDFKVESPLELELGKAGHIQTLVSTLSNSNFSGFQVSVSKQTVGEDGIRRWKRHAVGRFSPFASSLPQNIQKIDIPSVKSSCQEFQTEPMYSQFPELGLTFGKSFQSISSIWRNDSMVLAEVPLPLNSGNMGDYLCHPILADAMIQLFAFGTKDLTDLFLPVGIQRYVWFARTCSNSSTRFYISAKLSSAKEIGQNELFLYDEDGNLLVSMEGISVVKTSVETFLRSLSMDKIRLPGLFKEIWRYQPAFRVDFESSNTNLNIFDHMKEMRSQAAAGEVADDNMDRICFLYVFSAFLELGWKPEMGQSINSLQFLEDLHILKQHHGVVQRYLQILEEEKILRCLSKKSIQEGSTWQVLQADIPGRDKILSEITSLEQKVLESFNNYSEDVNLQKISGQKLASILSGKESALETLFPEKGNKNLPSAEKLYMNSPPMKRGYLTIVNYLSTALSEVARHKESNTSPVIRILEIGAGTGGTSSYVFSALEDLSIRYQYTYTDISSVLISNAKDKFAKFAKNIDFKVLNIEKDPMSQGFTPFHYDIIIASNVLHATENLRTTVRNSRMLLAPFGHFVIYETTKPLRTHDIIFGVLEGYWRFKDFELRPHHVLINENSWTELLRSNVFASTSVFPSSNNRCGVIVGQVYDYIAKGPVDKDVSPKKHWISVSNGNSKLEPLFSETMELLGRQTSSIKEALVSSDCKTAIQNTLDNKGEGSLDLEGVIYFVDGCHNEAAPIINTILNISQHFLSASLKNPPKIIVVTSGGVYIDDQSPTCPFSGTLWGFMKTLKNENPSMSLLILDVDPDELEQSNSIKEICSEIWSQDRTDYQVAYRGNKRHVLRLTNLEPTPAELRLPTADRYSILLPKTRSISDLQFVGTSPRELGEEEVEIEVRATSLNFRDLMVILRPEGYYTKANTIGTDFSGVVSSVGPLVFNLKVGDPVFGMTFAGAISSHTYAPCSSVAIKPKNLTFNQAAAFPTVFLTALYCLKYVANLQPEESILIHVASGGVGLCAIQIAKFIGARIIVTAGSKRKRGYLRSLGIDHVYHSRNTEYGNDIRKALDGNGVHVVLNSLTSGNFKEATLGACNQNARFVEMGKVAIWKPYEVKALRPDVEYTVIDLEQVDDAIIGEMTLEMAALLKEGKVAPLPYTRFQTTQCREALVYLQKARHIGKIVLTTPKMKLSEGSSTIEYSNCIFNDESSYLITGGLGGIGLEVAKLMAEQGAKHIVLVNRNPPSEYASGVLASLGQMGINIIAMQFDIGSVSQCEQLLEDLVQPQHGLPPLRGIFHAAGTLSDAIIPNQTMEKFHTVFNPKVQGAWNLHTLTRSYKLEYFVMFSSVAAILSPMGQSNHSAANFFLDSLAHYRNALGLVASSVNWGAWSEIGAASKTTVGNEGAFGVKPFSPAQGISAFKYLLNSQNSRATVVELDASGYKAVFPHNRHYLEEISSANENPNSSDNSETSTVIDSAAFWKEFNSMSGETLSAYLKSQIEVLVRQILKLGSSEAVEEGQSFTDMGMDSLMTVEMKNKLQVLLGKVVNLTSTTLSDHPNLSLLTRFILNAASESPE